MRMLTRLIAGSLTWVGLFAPIAHIEAAGLGQRLAGRILLQVEARGEAWYVDPVSGKRYFLGTAEDAYSLMRRKGLGVRHETLSRYQRHGYPKRLSGRILLDVEARGEAYYVVPGSLQGIYLGRASDAYALMRQYGLGITDRQLRQIAIDPESAPLPNAPTQATTPSQHSTPPTSEASSQSIQASALERETFELINAHRRALGLADLRWNEAAAEAARIHSRDMADGTVPFGHANFETRADRVLQAVAAGRIGENVAVNAWEDRPAAAAVHAWIQSPGHKANIERPSYTSTGIGVTQNAEGSTYFTQLFFE